MKHAIHFILLYVAFVESILGSQQYHGVQALLEFFPDADLNRDSVLSYEEALNHQNRITAAGKKGNPLWPRFPERAPKGNPERYVYKKVNDLELPLYVYKPNNLYKVEKRPALIFYHGGGWTQGHPAMYENQCSYFASRGLIAITVKYRLTSNPKIKIEDCIEDAKSAIRWVRKNADRLGVDETRIATAGGSAGGHLAVSTALFQNFNAATDDLAIDSKPNAMMLINPALGRKINDPLFEQTPNPTKIRSEIIKCMPIHYASKKQPPCIMFFGTLDEFRLDAAQYYKKVSETAGNDCTIMTYKDQIHGFSNHWINIKYYNEVLKEMDAFLVDQNWLPPLN